MKLIMMIALLASSFNVFANSWLAEVSSSPDTFATYIFYLHGSKEEVKGSTKKYKAAVAAIANSSAVVISEVRGQTSPNEFALTIKKQVDYLLEKGVPEKNITISGFSKGAVISLAVSGLMGKADINYVLLAGCSDFLNGKYDIDTSKVSGRILSIYDVSDSKFGSCESIIGSLDSVKFEELELDTGKGHKLFRIKKKKFIKQWRNPLIDWAGI